MIVEFHDEVLTAAQRGVLRMLSPVVDGLGFYLAGGTAVALRFGHRQSDDFDWFSEKPALPVNQLGAELESKGIPVVVGSVARGTFHGELDGVRVTFLEYRFSLLQPADVWSDYGCRIAGLNDLSAMKLSAIVQRGSRKDFVDIHEILSQGASLEQLLALYKKRFSVRDAVSVLYALAYFDDAEEEPMPRMLRPLKWDSIKKDLSKRLKHLHP